MTARDVCSDERHKPLRGLCLSQDESRHGLTGASRDECRPRVVVCVGGESVGEEGDDVNKGLLNQKSYKTRFLIINMQDNSNQ